MAKPAMRPPRPSYCQASWKEGNGGRITIFPSTARRRFVDVPVTARRLHHGEPVIRVQGVKIDPSLLPQELRDVFVRAFACSVPNMEVLVHDEILVPRIDEETWQKVHIPLHQGADRLFEAAVSIAA